MTISLSSPVGIGSVVLGHLVRIGAIAGTRNNPVPVLAAPSVRHPATQARSIQKTISVL